MNREVSAWAAAAVPFVGGDIATTWLGLSRGATEANPIPAAAMDLVGVVAAMVILKIIVMVALFTIFTRIPERHHRNTIPVTLLILGSAIVFWNLSVIP